MKFFVSRQCTYPDGDFTVEIVSGGSNYANPGMLTPMWRTLGEGKEFSDPRDAVIAALEIRDIWVKYLKVNRHKQDSYPTTVSITFGATMGFTATLPDFTDEELIAKGEEVYQKLPKCHQCGELRGKESYGNDYTTTTNEKKDRYPFCSESCADKHFWECEKESGVIDEGPLYA